MTDPIRAWHTRRQPVRYSLPQPADDQPAVDTYPALRTYHQWAARIVGPALGFHAAAPITAWGTCCGPTDNKEGPGIIRAQYAELLGPIYLARPEAADDLSDYGVQIRPLTDPKENT